MESEITSTSQQNQDIKIHFHADWVQYFRIWIVNLALTIITLGIYSPWAKVRTKKYLYGNVEIAGARFDYHADPVKILFGRAIVGVLFLFYSLGAKVSPILSFVFFAILMAVVPWLIVRGLTFTLANTSYRNIRFGFQKDYKGSYITYAKAFLWYALTLGLGIPQAIFLHSKYRIDRSRFGNETFKFKQTAGDFFTLYYSAAGIFVVGLLISAVVLFHSYRFSIQDVKTFQMGIALAVIINIIFITIAKAFTQAGFINLICSGTELGHVKIESSLQATELIFMNLMNLIVCILTLGLAIPWATIRVLKYRYDHIVLSAAPTALDKITSDSNVGSSYAAADAAVDFWDLDLGF